MTKVLFVCTGNTCRSVMAEGILTQLIKENGLEGSLEVSSAGIFAQDGEPPTIQTQMLLEEEGITFEEKGATSIDNFLLKEVDLVLTMTDGHRLMLQKKPGAHVDGKLYNLKEYTMECKKPGEADFDDKKEDPWDISDPYGGDLETYRKSFKEIKEEVHLVFKRLLGECKNKEEDADEKNQSGNR